MGQLLLGLAFDIYSAISKIVTSLYALFTDLSQIGITGIIKEENIGILTKNIYVVLSIVMLFYGTIIILTYIVNPDSSKSGAFSGTKVIKNIVISLGLLVLLPFIFDLAQDLQTSIVADDNIIAMIILGTSKEGGDDGDLTQEKFENNTKVVGHAMIRTLTKAILVPRDDADQNSQYVDAFNNDRYITGDSDYLDSLRDFAQMDSIFNFNWAMGIICCVFIAIMIFNYCFDVSVRLFKLLFYQIIAPIPVISYALPTKQSSAIFDRWVKAYLKTYVDLFLRLLLIYFVIFIFSSFQTDKIMDMTSISDNGLVNVFVIIGLLLFAKEAPQLIMDVFGIKPDGKFSINPMSRIREVPLVGSAVQTAGAAVGGLAIGTALGFKAAGGFKGIANGFKSEDGKFNFKGGMQNLGTMAGMGARGTIFGARAGYNQTSLLGVAKKDQKVDKTAYTAGASAVAQAITGSDKAKTGVVDRVFNNVATHLNEPTYKQTKAISDAEKAYNERVEDLSVLRDSQTEIKSNMNVAVARRNALEIQVNDLDTQINNVTNSRTSRVSQATAAINSEIANLEAEQLVTFGEESNKLQSVINQKKIERTDIERQVNNEIDQEINTLTTERQRVNRTFSEAIATERSYVDQYNEVTAKIDGGSYVDTVTGQNVTVDIGAAQAVENAKQTVKDEKDKLKYMHGPYNTNK